MRRCKLRRPGEIARNLGGILGQRKQARRKERRGVLGRSFLSLTQVSSGRRHRLMIFKGFLTATLFFLPRPKVVLVLPGSWNRCVLSCPLSSGLLSLTTGRTRETTVCWMGGTYGNLGVIEVSKVGVDEGLRRFFASVVNSSFV